MGSPESKKITVTIAVKDGTGYDAEGLSEVVIGRTEALDLVDNEIELDGAVRDAAEAAVTRVIRELDGQRVLERIRRENEQEDEKAKVDDDLF